MAVKAKTLARARAAVRPVTTAAKARTRAKARAVAQPMDQKCQTISPSQTISPNRTKAPRPRRVGLKIPTLSFSFTKATDMPANPFNGFTDFGVGIGLRVPHY